MHINCGHLFANFTHLKALLENLEFSFGVIALTKTWLDENNAHVFSSDGYNFCHGSRENIKGGGVVTQKDCM